MVLRAPLVPRESSLNPEIASIVFLEMADERARRDHPRSPANRRDPEGRGPLPPIAHRLPRLALDVLALDGLALVVGFLAAGQPDLDLDAAVLEVRLQGHDRVAPLRCLAPELA